jgi:hypothetical protein
MDRHVSVTLFESVVFLDVVQVVATDDNSPLHLHLLDNTSQNATTDGHISSEWALLINVGAFDSLAIQIKLVSFLSRKFMHLTLKEQAIRTRCKT